MQEIEAVGVDSLEGQALWLEVEVLSARSRISCLDALHALIGANMAQVAAIQEKAVSEHHKKVFFDDFCESSYDFYTMGLGTVSEAVEKGALSLTNVFVHEVVTEPWSGSMFSSRIWKNEWNMAQRVSEMVGRSLIAGHSTKRIARDIEEALGVDRRNAERLILTESAHVKTEADLQVFSRLGIEQVEFNVTLDSRTCTTECAQHDGEVIAIKDLKDGVNKPPLHPRCRCGLLPYDEDVAFFEKKYGTRIARDAEGKNISINGDMTYKEWREKYIDKPAMKRYNERDKETLRFIEKECAKKINTGRQDKHIRGKNNFKEGKSELTADSEKLLELYFAKGSPQYTRKGEWNKRVIFEHDENIGIYVSENGERLETKKGTMHYSVDKGVHIVPAHPIGKKRGKNMGILNDRKHLQGKQVKVFCDDGECLEGFWSEWWEADEIDWEDGETPCDSIGLFNIKDYWAPSVEILETEIKDIQEA